jgi:hypothetical protein
MVFVKELKHWVLIAKADCALKYSCEGLLAFDCK